MWIWVFQLAQTQVYFKYFSPQQFCHYSLYLWCFVLIIFWLQKGLSFLFCYSIFCFFMQAWLPCCKNTFPKLWKKQQQTVLNTCTFGLIEQFLSLQLTINPKRVEMLVASSIHQGNCQLKMGGNKWSSHSSEVLRKKRQEEKEFFRKHLEFRLQF